MNNKIWSVIFLVTIAAAVAFVCVPLEEDRSNVGQELGAPSLVDYDFSVSESNMTVILGDNPIVKGVVMFDDYTSEDNPGVEVGREKFIMTPNSIAFIRTSKGVVSMVHMHNYNTGASALIVNGVLRDAWDPAHGYEKINGVTPVFNENVSWRWGSGR